jgi:hypothetical protein
MAINTKEILLNSAKVLPVILLTSCRELGTTPLADVLGAIGVGLLGLFFITMCGKGPINGLIDRAGEKQEAEKQSNAHIHAINEARYQGK